MSFALVSRLGDLTRYATRLPSGLILIVFCHPVSSSAISRTPTQSSAVICLFASALIPHELTRAEIAIAKQAITRLGIILVAYHLRIEMTGPRGKSRDQDVG